MERKDTLYQQYLNILKEELRPAMGCTEPIALAYTGAKGRQLLGALPEGNRYAEIVGIRARPMPEPTKWNQKEREWLIQAKMDYALDMTEKEQAEQYERDVSNIADVLMTMAGGSETDG